MIDIDKLRALAERATPALPLTAAAAAYMVAANPQTVLELLRRLEAAERRADADGTPIPEAAERRAGADGTPIPEDAFNAARYAVRGPTAAEADLRPKEADLIRLLLGKPGCVFTNDEIGGVLFPGVTVPRAMLAQRIRMHVHNTREKLTKVGSPIAIENRRGFGWIAVIVERTSANA